MSTEDISPRHLDLDTWSTAEQVAAFRTAGTRVLLAIEHPNYGHIAVMPEAVRDSLAQDFA